MKAQLSLEYIVKVLILLVVVVVVIGLITKFSDQIRFWIKELFCIVTECKKTIKDYPITVTQDSFSSGEIATYVESCLRDMEELPENEQKDITCYILIVTNSFNAFPDEVRDNLSSDIKNRVEIKSSFDRDLVMIKFQDLGNKILIVDR